MRARELEIAEMSGADVAEVVDGVAGSEQRLLPGVSPPGLGLKRVCNCFKRIFFNGLFTSHPQLFHKAESNLHWVHSPISHPVVTLGWQGGHVRNRLLVVLVGLRSIVSTKPEILYLQICIFAF